MPKPKPLLTPTWQTLLTDYVTALAWSPAGTHLAVASAAGEVVLFEAKTGISVELQPPQGQSMDAIAFSADGRFLAAGGQTGRVSIWQITAAPQLVTTLEHPRVWVDTLQWHPQQPELALGLGRYAQVWDAAAQEVVTTLDFEASSVLDLAWHPSGNALVLAGNQGVKSWQREDWDNDPEVRETGEPVEPLPCPRMGSIWLRATTTGRCWCGRGITPIPGKCEVFRAKYGSWPGLRPRRRPRCSPLAVPRVWWCDQSPQRRPRLDIPGFGSA